MLVLVPKVLRVEDSRSSIGKENNDYHYIFADKLSQGVCFPLHGFTHEGQDGNRDVSISRAVYGVAQGSVCNAGRGRGSNPLTGTLLTLWFHSVSMNWTNV